MGSFTNLNMQEAVQHRAPIELEVVRSVDLGRPLFLTPRRFIRICRHIERGESASEACRRELVTYQGFRRHVTRNPKYQRRLKEAEQLREHYLKEFHIANVTRLAAQNLSASLWWLERRYPAEFSLHTVNRDSGNMEQQALCDRISLAQLVANAKLAAEIAANPPPGLRERDSSVPEAFPSTLPLPES
jgi:hypothetical protein